MVLVYKGSEDAAEINLVHMLIRIYLKPMYVSIDRRVSMRITIDQYISYRQFKATISSVTPPFITLVIRVWSPEFRRLFSLKTSHR